MSLQEIKDKVVEIISRKLDSSDFSERVIIGGADETEQVIKNYCNVAEVPQELIYTWANMTVDLLKYQYESANPNADSDGSGGDIDDIDLNGVTSIKVGDTDVKIGASEKSKRANRILNSHSPDLDAIALNYQEQLNRFRRVVW